MPHIVTCPDLDRSSLVYHISGFVLGPLDRKAYLRHKLDGLQSSLLVTTPQAVVDQRPDWSVVNITILWYSSAL